MFSIKRIVLHVLAPQITQILDYAPESYKDISLLYTLSVKREFKNDVNELSFGSEDIQKSHAALFAHSMEAKLAGDFFMLFNKNKHSRLGQFDNCIFRRDIIDALGLDYCKLLGSCASKKMREIALSGDPKKLAAVKQFFQENEGKLIFDETIFDYRIALVEAIGTYKKFNEFCDIRREAIDKAKELDEFPELCNERQESVVRNLPKELFEPKTFDEFSKTFLQTAPLSLISGVFKSHISGDKTVFYEIQRLWNEGEREIRGYAMETEKDQRLLNFMSKETLKRLIYSKLFNIMDQKEYKSVYEPRINRANQVFCSLQCNTEYEKIIAKIPSRIFELAEFLRMLEVNFNEYSIDDNKIKSAEQNTNLYMQLHMRSFDFTKEDIDTFSNIIESYYKGVFAENLTNLDDFHREIHDGVEFIILDGQSCNLLVHDMSYWGEDNHEHARRSRVVQEIMENPQFLYEPEYYYKNQRNANTRK